MSIEGSETREEVIEALGHQKHRATRCVQVVGNEALPTKWDQAHERINDLLDVLDQMPVTA